MRLFPLLITTTLQHGYGRGTPQVKRLVEEVGSVVNLFSLWSHCQSACNSLQLGKIRLQANKMLF